MAAEKPDRERISILETRMDHHDTMLDVSMNRVGELADTLIAQVERTNTILERFESKLASTTEKVMKWETTAKTVIKLSVVVSVLVGAMWSVFTFTVDHKTDVTITQVQK